MVYWNTVELDLRRYLEIWTMGGSVCIGGELANTTVDDGPRRTVLDGGTTRTVDMVVSVVDMVVDGRTKAGVQVELPTAVYLNAPSPEPAFSGGAPADHS